MKEIKAYQCDYCKKYYKHKSSAKRHEKICFYNPENRACITCDNFKTDYETVYVRPHGNQNYGDADYDVRYNYCDYDEKSFDTNEEWSKSFQNHCEHWKHRKPIEINDEEVENE